MTTTTTTTALDERHCLKIAGELAIKPRQVAAAAELLDGGATVPFIARYRKEATQGLDEVAILSVRDRLEQLRDLDKRREAILASLKEQGKLSDELRAAVLGAETMAALEDIYLPYRPKRRTRGTIAKEKGLEPLAKAIFEQGAIDVAAEAARFVDPAKGVESPDDALAGARDIIAEWVNEDAEARREMRELFERRGVLRSKVIKGKEGEGAKYRDYFGWEEPVAKAPSHRLLAIRRGASEGFLTFHIAPEEADAIACLERRFVKGPGPAGEQVRLAVEDGYERLLCPSMETELRAETKKRADEAAIGVFVQNVRELLLAPPLGEKRVLAIDPGLRTGCKVVCLDAQGALLAEEAIFPLEPHKRIDEAAQRLRLLCERHAIEVIAIGNGTGGREAMAFARSIDLGRPISIVMVNESGASVYSASDVAREEFPDRDVTVRGAVSIGRRLMDPLAELVKIDPKSIGVGQYQHDVDQKALKRALDDAVESCVNAVGVEVNTASPQLLGYVSGLGSKLASAIVRHRTESGPFRSRAALREVSGLGPKTFEQAAGFLRIRGGEHPLDASAVHPESYPVVERMARDLSSSVADLLRAPDLRQKIDIRKYVTEAVGIPTLTDILEELAKPGRDPRQRFEAFAYAEDVKDIADLAIGMKLPGIVTNVTAFGAFVDIGVHNDGLVHVSELADRFVKNPGDVVKVHQRVTVTVIGIDRERNRIALSLKTNPDLSGERTSRAGGEKKAGANPPPADRPAGRPGGGRPDRPERRDRADRPDRGRAPERLNPFERFFREQEGRR